VRRKLAPQGVSWARPPAASWLPTEAAIAAEAGVAPKSVYGIGDKAQLLVSGSTGPSPATPRPYLRPRAQPFKRCSWPVPT
jgi:hypothetical protein